MTAEQFNEIMQELSNLEQSNALLVELLQTQRSIYELVAVGFGMIVAGFIVAIFFMRLR